MSNVNDRDAEERKMHNCKKVYSHCSKDTIAFLKSKHAKLNCRPRQFLSTEDPLIDCTIIIRTLETCCILNLHTIN